MSGTASPTPPRSPAGAAGAPGQGSGGQAPGGQDPASAAAPPSRRSAILRSGFIIGILVIVFGVILPKYVNYQDVLSAFKDLTFQQFIEMTILGIVGWFLSGQLFTVLIERMSPIRGNASYLILSGIGSSVPFGPWNMGVVWVVVRGWGYENKAATSGIALYGVVNQLSRMVLPLLGAIALGAAGELSPDHGPVVLISVISVVAFFVTSAVILAIVRSDRAADWLGRTSQRVVDSVMKRLGRTGGPNVDGSVHHFRDEVGDVLRARGIAAILVGTLAQCFWAFVLLAALRIVGIPESVLTGADVLAVYALVSVITIIPISPGGAGIPELLFISGFTAIAGDQYNALITAGVFLYRLYNWFLPIPLAWILLKVARRGRPMLPTTTELKQLAAGDAA